MLAGWKIKAFFERPVTNHPEFPSCSEHFRPCVVMPWQPRTTSLKRDFCICTLYFFIKCTTIPMLVHQVLMHSSEELHYSPYYLSRSHFSSPLTSSKLLFSALLCSVNALWIILTLTHKTTIHYESFIHIKHTLGLPTLTEEDFTNNNPLLCSSPPAKNQA